MGSSHNSEFQISYEIRTNNIIQFRFQPSNIFLRDENFSSIPSVLLGDFGLACLHQTEIVYNTTVAENKTAFHHSVGIGTSVYAAPEQQNSTLYDNAVSDHLITYYLIHIKGLQAHNCHVIKF